MPNREVELIELIKEEPGDLTIDEILEKLPKGKDAARNLIIKLQDHIKNELLEEKQLEVKKKKVNEGYEKAQRRDQEKEANERTDAVDTYRLQKDG